jgi:hypothetical protein
LTISTICRNWGGILLHAVDRARPERLYREFRIAVSADHNDWSVVAPDRKLTENMEAVEVGENEVKQDDINSALPHALQAGGASPHDFQRAFRGVDLEKDPHELGVFRIVLSIQHMDHGFPVPESNMLSMNW